MRRTPAAALLAAAVLLAAAAGAAAQEPGPPPAVAPRSEIADIPFPDPPAPLDDPGIGPALDAAAAAAGRACGAREAFVWILPAGSPRREAIPETAHDRLRDRGRRLARVPLEDASGARAVIAEAPERAALLLWAGSPEALLLAVCDLGPPPRPPSGVG
jgi:hypothetical protein